MQKPKSFSDSSSSFPSSLLCRTWLKIWILRSGILKVVSRGVGELFQLLIGASQLEIGRLQLVRHVGPHLRRFAGGARAQRLQFLLFDLFEDVAVLLHQKLAPQQRADAGLGDRDILVATWKCSRTGAAISSKLAVMCCLSSCEVKHNQHDLRPFRRCDAQAANQAAHFRPIECQTFRSPPARNRMRLLPDAPWRAADCGPSQPYSARL